jgi:tetratricopeptide (TPR) repeat protein
MTRAMLVSLLAVSTAALAAPRPAPPRPAPPRPAPPAGPRMEPDDLPGPPPEVVKESARVDLPAVPGFDLVVTEPGFHGARELRIRGKPLLGTDVKVKGYITEIYDCAAQLAASNPGATPKQIATAIQRDPTLCERAKFFLGDTRDAAREAAIRVVDVPRIATRAERSSRKQAELKGVWPEVPRIAVGDHVVVTGTWALSSPHNERDTDGLVVYKALEHVAPSTAPAAAAAPAGAGAATEPDIDVATRPPLRAVIGDIVRNQSVDRLNACSKALAARQYDAAITACQAAIAAWPDNHRAWYAWGSAHMARSEWQKAREAVEHAQALRPDDAMYQLYFGIAVYEAEHERVRDEQARKLGKKPEEVAVEPALMHLDAARDALRRAVKRNPDLWRAHYYLGRVYRDLGESRREAEQFSATIATHPSYRFGYIALTELYRRWGYLAQALQVAQLGCANVPPAESSELWYEVGMAHDARRDDDKAIDAFTRAIAARPDDAGSKFQRGQAYFRKKDFASARRDLDEVARSGDPAIASIRPLAVQMLDQIAKKQH